MNEGMKHSIRILFISATAAFIVIAAVVVAAHAENVEAPSTWENALKPQVIEGAYYNTAEHFAADLDGMHLISDFYPFRGARVLDEVTADE